eukprot:m.215341 g.215341  ORF g.215341 m.215341 type:complete len:239 (-) comp13799_c5_seq1:561-1277(-)
MDSEKKSEDLLMEKETLQLSLEEVIEERDTLSMEVTDLMQIMAELNEEMKKQENDFRSEQFSSSQKISLLNSENESLKRDVKDLQAGLRKNPTPSSVDTDAVKSLEKDNKHLRKDIEELKEENRVLAGDFDVVMMLNTHLREENENLIQKMKEARNQAQNEVTSLKREVKDLLCVQSELQDDINQLKGGSGEGTRLIDCVNVRVFYNCDCTMVLKGCIECEKMCKIQLFSTLYHLSQF